MLKNNKIEGKVAETILQDSEKIKIGKKTYEVRPVSVATLIQVSKLVSKLPNIELKSEEVFYGSLMIAKDCGIIGTIAATLVLGVRKPTLIPTAWEKLLKRLKIASKTKVEKLGEEILFEMTSLELNNLMVSQLKRMGISDFFGLTTSLLEVNILRKTKEVV